MSYEVFCKEITGFLDAETANDVVFSHDFDKGRHYARFSDGTTIVGRDSSSKMTTNFGSGHCAMFEM